MKEVRTRFAPSPTGFLHVGGVRTALFAWLLAKQSGGKFLLRLEDTDQAREVIGADQHIMDSLKWVGIEWDEGPDKDGPFGPYRQSQRLDIYKHWAQKLIDEDRAYADPYTPEQLEQFRTDAKSSGKPFLFRNHRPDNPPKWDGSQPLRLKSNPRVYEWNDLVMGSLSTGPEAIDDFILIKSDSYPTYNFAHIVDDHLMGITHVVRSQEFISSMPRFLNLYDALKIDWPNFATLPFVLGPDGKKKLSKRDGPKDILTYAKEGYLPEAMLNFLATLGWNDGTTQEIFSRDEIIEKFDISRVQRGGAKFDEQRLTWLNGFYIRQIPAEQLLAKVKDFWPAEAKSYDDDYKLQVLSLIQERLKHFSEIPELTGFFFSEPDVDLSLITDSKQLGKTDNKLQLQLLKAATTKLAGCDFDVPSLTDSLNQLLTETGQKPGILFSLIRICLTWTKASPGLAETMAVLGKQITLDRINQAIEKILV